MNILLLWRNAKTAGRVPNITDTLQRVVLRRFQYRDYNIGRRDDRLIRKDLQGCGRCLIKKLSQNFPGRTPKNHENPVRIASVRAEIRTEHLPNTNLQRYIYSSLFEANSECRTSKENMSWNLVGLLDLSNINSFSHTFVSLWKRALNS
jgi:hypothetical protein